MKRYLFFILVILFFSHVAFAKTVTTPSFALNKTGSIGDYPSLSISQFNYEPFPIEPGDTFDLWIKLKNVGNRDAQGISLELVDTYPFLGGTDTKRNVGTVPSQQEALLHFENVRVAGDAPSGIHELKFRALHGGAFSGEGQILNIRLDVRAVTPVLSLEVATEPSRIPQGAPATLKLFIKNTNTILLKNLDFLLLFPSEIVPIGGSNEKLVDQLIPGESANLSFEILANGDAAAKAYNIPLNVTYYDAIGTRFEKHQSIGILVGRDADFLTNIEESTLFEKKTKGKITISVSNVGPSTMNFLTLKLLPSSDYVAISPSQSYLGNLESDDFETAEFELYSNVDNPRLVLELRYKDPYNVEHVRQDSIILNTFSRSELKKFGIQSNGSSNISRFAVIVLGLIFLYFFYRSWKQKRELPFALCNGLLETARVVARGILFFRWRNIKRLPRRLRRIFQGL
ncbi:COG1361 S-layer family protein [Candidatus Woesearchaeota archaeon]|nr:COG1361 S-layer family protein [Candidatus Woesearchaeota archaeon]